MFTTDELEAAGQRAATHPVETIPDVMEIQREVVRRRQSKRLLIGASTATVMLFAVGGILLLGARDNQVTVITASPVTDSEVSPASEVAGQEARTGSTDRGEKADAGRDGQLGGDGRSGSDGASDGDGEDGVDGGDGGDGRDGAASSSSAEAEDVSEGEVTNGYTTETDDLDGDQDGKRGEDGKDREDGSGDYDDLGFVFPEDVEEWLEQLNRRDRPIDGEWRDLGLWPFGLEGLDIDIAVGDEAISQAERSEERADDALIVDGRTVWVRRQNNSGQPRKKVTVSTLVDADWFVTATGPADQEDVLLKLISRYDGQWEDGLIPEDLDRLRDRDWLTWPPTEDDWKDWQDARKDWLKDQEELLKESQDRAKDAREQAEEKRKQAEEERKRVEEDRKRIEEERRDDDDDDDDDD